MAEVEAVFYEISAYCYLRYKINVTVSDAYLGEKLRSIVSIFDRLKGVVVRLESGNKNNF